MRRGTIVVGGDVGQHAAWQMRAGTIMVLGKCNGPPGIDMRRGSIFAGRIEEVAPSFVEAANSDAAIFKMMERWLYGASQRYELELPQVKFAGKRAWCGDVLNGRRGELIELSVAK